MDADRFLNYIGFNFETENLDTMYKVILMSSWPPEVIHEFIVEGIPELPLISRYVLVHGLRSLWTRLQDVGEWTAPTDSELLPMRTPPRYLLNFLAALDYDMSEHERVLFERGLDSLHIVTALRRWSAGDLHAMLRDVLPDFPVVSSPLGKHNTPSWADCEELAQYTWTTSGAGAEALAMTLWHLAAVKGVSGKKIDRYRDAAQFAWK